MNRLNVLAIKQLEGGTYTIDTVLNVIKQITDWALAVGISLAGIALVVSFIMYAVVDVDQKPRVKTRILQTLLGIFGGGLIGAAVGAGVGYAVGYLAGGTYANGLVAKSITGGVRSFLSQANKVHHVLGKAAHNLSNYTVKSMGKLMKQTFQTKFVYLFLIFCDLDFKVARAWAQIRISGSLDFPKKFDSFSNV